MGRGRYGSWEARAVPKCARSTRCGTAVRRASAPVVGIMAWLRNYLTFGFFGVLLFTATADNSVHILSKYTHQQITSSTLNWLPRAHYDPSKEIIIGGFEIEETEQDTSNNQADKSERKRPLYVCRVLHIGVWVAGSQKGDEQNCTVSIHGSVQSYSRYELLENVENAARVTWQPWDRYKLNPIGAVATDSMYVARHEVPLEPDEKNDSSPVSRFTHYIGTLNLNDNLGIITYVKADGTQGSAKSGEVLVETEPVNYELTRVKLNWPKRSVIKRVPQVLGKVTISNKGPEPAKMAEAFGYEYKYSVYWGQVHAIIKGLNTSITLANGSSLPRTVWGMKETENRTGVYTVEIFLEPGTGVDVTLRANYSDMEVPYSGVLVSHYEDGETKSRLIGGNRREESMFDIAPEFGPIYFLNNYSLVPTTAPPPTTEPSTTTYSPADVNGEMRKHQPGNVDHDENMIIPPKKSDMSNMQSDDGGPLSLKNKVDGLQSGTGLFKSNLMLIPILVTVIHRIT
ncbi:hypothetical protein KM043_015992 [Ampulex compressa]|nr:hypothetical protein KM043_015992 [Ampulex compressa]